MKISYAIPVHNEYKEIRRLLNILFKGKRDEDEIVVQCDKGNTTQDVYFTLQDFAHLPNFKIVEFPLNRDFASYKNNLKNSCSNEWIFQIDADEYPHEHLLENLPLILQQNPYTEVFWVPRINTVDGLTKEHIQKWRWKVEPDGRINFPDYQCRILQNSPTIQWVSKVHEVLYGHSSQSQLPTNDEFCLVHHKSIKRQEHQNKFYDTL